MYKTVTIEDTVRVPPKRFGEDLKSILLSELENTITGRVDKDIGILLTVTDVTHFGEGKIILGDGAIYYDTKFKALVYQPVLHEVVEGEVIEITEFGAFVNFGPIDGLIHVSQITEDFMSYDQKGGNLIGKETKRVVKVADKMRARIVTVSLKDRISDSKIGLTMRQPYLGKLEWLEEDKKEAKKKQQEKEKAAKKEGKKEPAKKEEGKE